MSFNDDGDEDWFDRAADEQALEGDYLADLNAFINQTPPASEAQVASRTESPITVFRHEVQGNGLLLPEPATTVVGSLSPPSPSVSQPGWSDFNLG